VSGSLYNGRVLSMRTSATHPIAPEAYYKFRPLWWPLLRPLNAQERRRKRRRERRAQKWKSPLGPAGAPRLVAKAAQYSNEPATNPTNPSATTQSHRRNPVTS
jgi:hypothetical protein